MKRHIHISIFIILASVMALTLSCCGRHTEVRQKMDQAERLMETRPDSSLEILNDIYAEELGGKEESARYALLKSMALDKNYIDTTDFKVLQPAIDYYLKKGKPDEKLRTYYYQGVIFLNKGDNDSALEAFVKGSHLSNICRDSLTLARLFVAEGLSYKAYFDYDSFIKLCLKASSIYQHLSKRDLEFNCLVNALNGSIIMNNRIQSDSILRLLDGLNSSYQPDLNELSGHKLLYTLKFGSDDDIKNMIRDKTSIAKSSVDILDLALANNKIGNNDEAFQLLECVSSSGKPYDTLRYLSISADVLEKHEHYREALNQYKRFYHRQDSIDMLKFEYKAQAIEKTYLRELEAKEDARRKSIIIWGCIGSIILLIMIVIILLLLVRSNKTQKELANQRAQTAELKNGKLQSEKMLADQQARNAQLENENLAHRVAILENESESLKNLIKSNNELPQEVQDTIKVRLEILNSLLASHITSDAKHQKPYEAWLKELTENNENFMNSNRIALQATHPEFIRYFIDHGLTKDEINYVCLYAIGLNGKEVGKYLKKPSHVNMSSAIRSKLGMNMHETNLSIQIRNLLKEL